MKKVLVTGASGYVGRHICLFLQKKDYDVCGIVRRETDEKIPFPIIVHDLSLPLCLNENIDFIVHTAGSHPGSGMEKLKSDNIDTMSNVIKLAQYANTKKIVFLSSVSIYGNVKCKTVSEDTDIVNPNGYGLSKRIAEMMLLEKETIEGVCLRLPGIFGIGADKSWLVNVAKRIYNGEAIDIYSPEFMSNNFVYIDDLARYIDIMLKKECSHSVYLLGSEEKISILDCVNYMKKMAKSKSKIIIRESQNQSFSLDIRRAITDGYRSIAPRQMIEKFFSEGKIYG